MKKLLYPSAGLPFVILLSLFSHCADGQRNMKNDMEADSLKKIAMVLTAQNEIIAKNLATFDELDYEVFSNQQWKRLHESHSKDVKVNWPDGHSTTGLEKHTKDLADMFVYAPDTNIKQHPIKFGSGNMTCVIGVMKGTFTAPKPMPDGTMIKPTGKSFSIPMCTVGIWKDGVMVEEYLFWDNQAYMTQLGIAKQ